MCISSDKFFQQNCSIEMKTLNRQIDFDAIHHQKIKIPSENKNSEAVFIFFDNFYSLILAENIVIYL